MKMSEQFAGNYLKATDLPQPRLLTIQTVQAVRMPEGDTKPSLAFFEEKRQLVLNKTNGFQLAEWFGDDAAGWSGRQVELYATQTNYSGRLVPCIRVRLPIQQPPPQWQQPIPPPAPQWQPPIPQPPPQWQPPPAAVQPQPVAAPQPVYQPPAQPKQQTAPVQAALFDDIPVSP